MSPPIPIFWMLLAYALGSFPTGYLLGKWIKKIDIREHGSGNSGATNVFRTVGKRAGTATLIIDFLKGCLPVLTALHFYPRAEVFASMIGLAAIAGHNWSFWLKFNGGKGVATSAGVFLALLPAATLLSLVIFGVGFAIGKHVSIGSMSGAVFHPLFSWMTGASGYLIAFSFCCAVLIVVAHRKNIVRLLRAREKKNIP